MTLSRPYGPQLHGSGQALWAPDMEPDLEPVTFNKDGRVEAHRSTAVSPVPGEPYVFIGARYEVADPPTDDPRVVVYRADTPGSLTYVTHLDLPCSHPSYPAQLVHRIAIHPAGRLLVVTTGAPTHTERPESIQLLSWDPGNEDLTSLDAIPADGAYPVVRASSTGLWAVFERYVLRTFAVNAAGNALVQLSSYSHDGWSRRSLAWSPDGRFLLVGAGFNVELFSVTEAGVMTHEDTLALGGQIRALHVSQDGRFAVAAVRAATEKLALISLDYEDAELTNEDEINVLTSASYTLGGALSANGRWFLVGGTYTRQYLAKIDPVAMEFIRSEQSDNWAVTANDFAGFVPPGHLPTFPLADYPAGGGWSVRADSGSEGVLGRWGRFPLIDTGASYWERLGQLFTCSKEPTMILIGDRMLFNVGSPNQFTGFGALFNTYYHDSRMQFILYASEMENSPLQAGSLITGIELQSPNIPARDIVHLYARVKHFAGDEVTDWETEDWEQVFYAEFIPAADVAGDWYVLAFDPAFEWNGEDNILFDLYRDDSNWAQCSGGLYTRTTAQKNRSIYGYADAGADSFPGDGMTVRTNRNNEIPEMVLRATIDP